MKPTGSDWWVVYRERRTVGYFHIGETNGLPLLSHAVARSGKASEMFDAVSGFLRKLGHGKAGWQTCVGSIWEEELHKRGFREGDITSHIRMCLPIGSPIDTHGQRPEFDGVSTW